MIISKAILVIGSLFAVTAASSLPKFHDPYFFPNRSGIVHLHEWKYSDIARECEDFLGPKGYAGVQTSPASENLILEGRPWYERYQPISYEIRTRSGDSLEFFDMTQRCREAGIRIYVDVIPNHMSGNTRNARGTGGSFADPDNFYFPAVPYTRDDFHQPPCQINNFDDLYEARNCELVGLHDLDQSIPRVRWAIINYLNRLTALGAAGFRVDASKHMWPEDLEYIYSQINNLPEDLGFAPNSRPFIYQEVGDSWKFNYTGLGAVTEFAHSTNIAGFFKNEKKSSFFENYGGPHMGMLPSESALTFVDNHDLQRQNPYTLNYKSPREFKAAYAFTLGHSYGIPRVMSSFDFTSDQDGPPHDRKYNIVGPRFDKYGQCRKGWVCEHRWPAIVNMIEFRNVVGDSPLTNWWSDGNSVASFCRGNKGFLLISAGQSNFNGTVNTCLPRGAYCNVLQGNIERGKCTGESVVVDAYGKAAINISINAPELAVALHVGAKEA